MPALPAPSHLSAGQLGGAHRNTVGLSPGARPLDGRGHKPPPLILSVVLGCGTRCSWAGRQTGT